MGVSCEETESGIQGPLPPLHLGLPSCKVGSTPPATGQSECQGVSASRKMQREGTQSGINNIGPGGRGGATRGPGGSQGDSGGSRGGVNAQLFLLLLAAQPLSLGFQLPSRPRPGLILSSRRSPEQSTHQASAGEARTRWESCTAGRKVGSPHPNTLLRACVRTR